MSRKLTRNVKTLIAAFLFPAALSACENSVYVRGNFPDPDKVAELETGATTRRDVAEALGSPSTLSTFKDQVWYYIGERVHKEAFFDPEVMERSVLVVSFDQKGVLQEARSYTLEDGRVIDPVTRETPTEGQDLTVIQQMLGNIGKFPTPGGN